MIKSILTLAVLSLALLPVLATDIDAAAKLYKPCPCKCFIGYKANIAVRQCRRPKFSYQCGVAACIPKYHHHYPSYLKGKTCCDKELPSVTPSTTPTASPTPSPSKKPIVCPCYCGKRGAARAMCRYKPYCEVTKCPPEENPKLGKYGYYKPKFQCCYKPHYKPPHH